MINNFFDHVFCINLDRRPDRKQQAEYEFMLREIAVEFVSGVDGQTLDLPPMMSVDNTPVSRGDIGCVLSHLKVAKLAKERGYNNYFVFEDDAELTPGFNTKFEHFIKQVPDNWQMIYLGGNHDGGFEMIGENVAKIFRTFTTHAIGVNSNMYDEIIGVLSKQNEKVDIAIASLHTKFNCYVSRPHLVFQRAGVSDILERFTNYDHLRK